MQQDHLHKLVQDFLDNKLDTARQQEFYSLLTDPAQRENLSDVFVELTGEPDMALPFDVTLQPLLHRVLDTDRPTAFTKVRRLTRWSWAAAAMLVLTAGSAYWMLERKDTPLKAEARNQLKDVRPGGDGAILTLADGSTVMLDSAGNGVVAKQGGSTVVLNQGQIAYTPSDAAASTIAYNTISTPRGKQFRIQLPDGSKVWLNAASSIRYPVVFNGNSREIEVTGEAYFEIMPVANKPFLVKFNSTNRKNSGTIEVLGTAFNLNTYTDEPVAKATLLNGSIRINKERILTPGEQAIINSNNELRITDDLNTNDEIAWKNGLFVMHSTALPTLLRQLSRWYDIEIEINGELPQREFGGTIAKNMNLSDVIQVLEIYGIHCRLVNGRLEVSN